MTLSYSKTYPAAQKNPPKEKVVNLKYVGTIDLTKSCFMFVFDTVIFYEPRVTFLNIKASFSTIPLYFMFGAHL